MYSVSVMLFKNVGLKWNLGIEKDTLTQKISPVYQLGTIEPSFNRSPQWLGKTIK